jgi:surface antigen
MLRSTTRRGAGLLAGASAALLAGVRPAYAYNCVNVVLRDPFWGQFRRVIEQGWNAAGVAPALARVGFEVNPVPAAGAIMSWPAGMYGASEVGHVGLVQAVNPDGTVLVRHENWPYGSPEHLQTFLVRPGIVFVHVPTVAEPEPAIETAEGATVTE